MDAMASRSASRPQSGAPPKSSAGKKGAAAPPPASSTAAADELKQKAELLERNLRNEELARNYMQLERDKIQAFWDITKQDLGDKKAELRLKDRELEEAQDQHALELKVYKQKVKHLLYEHQLNISRLKADGEESLKQQADVFAQQEAQLADDKRRLRQHVREQELSAEEVIKQFRLDNAKQVSRLRQEFELKARQFQQKYEAQLRALQKEAEQQYATDLAEVEQRKNAHIAGLMQQHETAFAEMRAYYNQVTHANLDLIRTLKEEIAEMKAAEVQREKLVNEVVRENKRLADPLNKAVQEADLLRQQVEGAERDRAALAAVKARLAAAEKQARATEWELEVTQQRLDRVQRERDDLQRRMDSALLCVQQRSAMEAALMLRQLNAASSELQAAQQGQHSAAACRPASVAPKPSTAAGRPTAHTGAGQVLPLPAGAPAESSNGRRGSKAPRADDWVKAMLEAALHTPLPDPDADILEDDAPADILAQIAELEAADGADQQQLLQPMKKIVEAEAKEVAASSRAAAALAALPSADALSAVISAANGLSAVLSGQQAPGQAGSALHSVGGSPCAPEATGLLPPAGASWASPKLPAGVSAAGLGLLPLAGLEAKLSQAALGAQAAVEVAQAQRGSAAGDGGSGADP